MILSRLISSVNAFVSIPISLKGKWSLCRELQSVCMQRPLHEKLNFSVSKGELYIKLIDFVMTKMFRIRVRVDTV